MGEIGACPEGGPVGGDKERFVSIMSNFVNHCRTTSFGKTGLLVIFLAVFGLGLASCDETANLTAQQHLDRAKSFQVAGDLRSSVIELKNALQKNPDSAPARFLLGVIYNDLGNGEAAEKELSRAAALGIDPKSVAIPLGQAWLLQRQFDKVLSQLSFTEQDAPEYKAAILVLHGQAYRQQRQLGKAEETFQAALAWQNGNLRALVGLGQVALDRLDRDRARTLLKQAMAQDPNDPEVLALEGDVAFADQKYAESEAAYRRLVAMRQDNIRPRTGLALALIAQGKTKPAIEILDDILSFLPDALQVNYLRALAAYRAEDYETAKTHVVKVLSRQPAHLPSIFLAGATSYALGQYEQAANYLRRFVASVPGHDVARRLLAATFLRLERRDEALETLSPLAENSDDAEILDMVGMVAIRSGDYISGSRYLERAVTLNPEDARVRADLGASRIAMGDTEQGLKDLESALKLDPKLEKAAALRVITLLRSRNYPLALAAADEILDRKPGNANGLVLKGLALFGLGRRDDAQAAFEKAFELVPGHATAGANLATLAVLREDFDAARAYLEKVVAANPGNAMAMVQLAYLASREGRRDEVISWLEKAVEATPQYPVPRVFLGQEYLQAGQPLKALAVTQPALKDYPRQAELLAVVAAAQLETSQYADAVITLQALIKERPKQISAYMELARAQAILGHRAEMRETLEQALAVDPDRLETQVSLARMALFEGRLDEAEAFISRLSESHPDHFLVQDLEGMLAMRKGQPRDAILALERIKPEQRTARVTLTLARAKWITGQQDGAITVLTDWIAEHPRDARALGELGNYQLARNQLAEADKTFTRITELLPDNWGAYNNLAWVAHQRGMLKRALRYARKALDLDPDNPAILDTLAMIELDDGNAAEALELMRKAVDELGDSLNPVFDYHLARALAANDESEEARTILRRLLAEPQPFFGRAEAAALYRKLGG